jgi:hypothetical protein
MSEKTVKKAQMMVHDLLLLGFSGVKISDGAGVNQVTIGSIRNGKSQRISEKVFDRIWDFWSEHAPPKEELEKLRAEKSAKLKSPQPTKMQASTAPTSPTASQPKPKRKYTKRVSTKPVEAGSFISRQYVPVDLTVLRNTIDNLIAQFSEAVAELESIREQIKSV